MKRRVWLSYSLGAVCAPLGSVIGFSQAAAQTADVAVDGGDIVVTATRSKEALSRVPISVQAFGAEALDRLTVREVDDIARISPGLVLNRGSSGASNVAIRGISSDAGSATTGIYIDDVPIQVRSLGFSSSTQFPVVFDLERIEVLRGPQGTLFGAGSEGGTLRFLQPAPSLTKMQIYSRSELSFTKNGSASYEFGAAVGGPIIEDKLAFRISGYFRRDGGWIDRAAGSLVVLDPTGAALGSSAAFSPSGESYKNSNWQNSTALRGVILAKLSDTLKATVSVNYQKQFNHDNITAFWAAASNPEASSFVAPLFRQGVPTDANQLTSMNVETFDALRSRFTLTSLALEWAPGNVVLNSTTAYFDASKIQWTDGTPAYSAIYAGIDYPELGWKATSRYADSQKNFTQEIRLQSVKNNESRLYWVIGGYYSHAIQNSVQDISANLFHAINSYFGIPNLDNGEPFGPGSTNYQNIWGVDLLPNSVSYDVRLRVVDQQMAGFGQVDYKLFSGLTVTAGMRISRNSFNFVGLYDGPENNLNAPFGAPCTTGNCTYQDPNGEFAPAFPGGTSSQVETSSTPKFTVSYQVDKSNLFYATASKGFRPGGGQVQLPAQCRADLGAFGYIDANGNPAAPTSYKSDSLWNYEVGSKNKLFGGRLLLDGSAYIIKWKDTQANLLLPNCGYQFTANLADATAKGFELAAQLRPAIGLSLGANFAYNNASFDKEVASTTGGVIYSAKSALPQSGAPWTSVLQADYERGMTEAVAYGHIDYTFTSRFRRTGESDDRTLSYRPFTNPRGATNQVNLKLGVRIQNLDVSVFANNILNAHPLLNYGNRFNGAPVWTAYTFRPRTVGITASFRQ